MDDAGLDLGLREHGGDRLGEALQAVDHGDKDVLDAAVLEFVHDPEPELGALGLLDPEAEDLLAAVRADAERDIHRLVADRALVADLHAQGVEEDQRVERLERPVLPLGDLVEDGVGHRADQVGRDLDPVELAQVTLDLAGAHAPSVHGDDLVVEAGEAPLVFGDELRVEGREPVARDLQVELAGAGQHGLRAVAVAAVGPTVRLAAFEMVLQLGVERPLGQGLLQPVQQAPVGQGGPGIGSAQELVQHFIRDGGRFASRHTMAPSAASYGPKHGIPDSSAPNTEFLTVPRQGTARRPRCSRCVTCPPSPGSRQERRTQEGDCPAWWRSPLPFAPLFAALAEVHEPHRAQGQRYSMRHLLLFSVLAVLAGATSYQGIVTFIGLQRDRLNTAFGACFRRAPAGKTLPPPFLMLDRDDLEAAFRRHVCAMSASTPGVLRTIALDGKTLRGSVDHLNDRKAAHVLSAFASDAALILAHQEVAGAPDEIPAVPRLIAGLGTTAVVFAADAPLCPHEGFARAAETGNALLVRVKDNQPTLHAALAELCAGQPLIGCVARVSRLTYTKDPRSGLWPTREEIGYYACQIRRDAKSLAQAIRAHWGIENRDHYVRDVTLGEEDSRIRKRPGVMARIRSVALNILRANGVQNVSQALYTNALSFDRLLALGAI